MWGVTPANAALAARKAESAQHGKLRGVRFSAYIEACGLAPSNIAGALGSAVGYWESARRCVYLRR